MKKAPKPANQGTCGKAQVKKSIEGVNPGNGTGEAAPKGGLHTPRTRPGIGGSRKP